MQKSTKVLLVVLAAVVFLGVIAVGGLVYWGVTSGKQFAKDFSKAAKEEDHKGRQDGASAEENDCIKLTIARSGNLNGFRDMMALNVYFTGCLRVAKPSQGFCDGVPQPGEVMKTARWRFEKCIQMGGTEQVCSMLASPVIGHCDEVRKRGTQQDEPAAQPGDAIKKESNK